MTPQPSLTGRALIAVGLMIGFYVLALGIGLGLLWIPYAEWAYADRIHLKLAFGSIVAGAMVLWSILPRRDKFVAPGPRLTPAEHPRLFNELQSIASATGQSMPGDVYLVSDVNAWVSQRGGVMGFGSHRVMGLGLPLLSVLKISEMRAVLAHEFGHYHGGDTRLGPWIYKTRAAIGRTVSNLGDDSWVQKPFLWYGTLFLRITHAISRQQELTADALAARIAGATAMISGLKAVHAAAVGYNSYWGAEVVPLLQAGYHPPMGDGFARFLSAQPVAASLTKSVDEELAAGQADPYDTHPPLRERVAALAHLPTTVMPENEPTALSLLERTLTLERDLLVQMAGATVANDLKNLDWSAAGAKVYLPQWVRITESNAAVFSGLTAAHLPRVFEKPGSFRQHFQKQTERSLSDEQLLRTLAGAAGCALAATLAQQGFTLSCELGMPVSFRRDNLKLEPFTIASNLQSGALTPQEWQKQCLEAGIADVDLSAKSA
ncbi:MAG TPA: M48 family metalloprotease [Terriglobia bacterium]|nr:M48 family metalloprotease [Terriglobia bacterium]